MSTYNRDHVEFALGLYSKAHPELKELEYYSSGNADAYDQNDSIVNIKIDLDFLRKVPIEDVEAYNDAVYEILNRDGCLPKETGIARTAMNVVSAITFAIHNTPIAQRLEAIYISQGGK